MDLTDLSISKNALKAAIQDGVHDAQDSRDCSDYVIPFGQRSSELSDIDSDASNAFRLLSIVATLRLDPDDPEDPFQPGMVTSESRTAVVDDLPQRLLDIVEQNASVPNDPDLRARLCDICWIRRRNQHLANQAVLAYIEAGRVILTSDHSLNWAERFERGLQIARSLNQASLQDSAEDALRTLALQQDTEAHAVATAIQLLHTYSRDLERAIADRAIEMSERPESTLIWRERFYGLAAKCFRRSRLKDESRSAAISHAESFVSQASEVLERPYGGHAVAAQFLERAVQAYRQIAGTENRRDELHQQLLQHQKQMSREMFSNKAGGTEISEHLQIASDEVTGKSFAQSLRILALSGRSPDRGELRKTSTELIRDFPLSFLWPSTIVSSTGKTIAQHSGVSPNSDAPDDSVVLREMHSLARRHRDIAVIGRIDPMRRTIIREHAVRIHSFLDVVQFNPLIPHGREYLFARGLCAGMHGDFLLALHLLVPQLEHAIRHVLESQEVIVSSLRSNGIQQEHLLGRLFNSFEAELDAVFGPDTIFDLRGLLVIQESCNVRNLLAHGLLEAEAFHSPTAVYTWWLILRLVVIGHVRGKDSRNADDEIGL